VSHSSGLNNKNLFPHSSEGQTEVQDQSVAGLAPDSKEGELAGCAVSTGQQKVKPMEKPSGEVSQDDAEAQLAHFVF
jgi:hypothetical protein